jgi:exopolyphosphatase / guanosine-5'-triphosphate,3'-diphosphate pyrophosphatase
MICACIDIGSNTTRLLVATPRNGGLRELCQQRAFTRIGRALRDDGRIAARKIDEVADVVATQARTAEQLGAHALKAVATAAIREAGNRDDLVAAVRSRCGVDVEVLTDGEEARLAFVGATRALTEPTTGAVAVVDVGGGSSELAIGTVDGGMSWSASLRLGSGTLSDAYLRSDPPGPGELNAIRQHVAGAFEGLAVPPAQLGVAVGGSATSLRRLVGALLEPETLERGLRVLATTPVADVARTYELDPERVKLLPAGILLLEETSTRMGLPLQIARGGLREGVILEMMGTPTSRHA